MIVTSISASNVKAKGDNSASTKVCNLIGEIISGELDDTSSINTISLMNYNLKPCILCGKCSDNLKCIYDEDFNKLFTQLQKSDKLFFVVPHYSPIPSKLLIIFEKLNEIIYGGWLKDKNFKFPLTNKQVGIIGHGGMPENEDVLKYYHDTLVSPVANTLESLSLKPVGLNEKFTKGAVFGLKDESCIKDNKNSLFPDIIQDWELIKERIKPLVLKVIQNH